MEQVLLVVQVLIAVALIGMVLIQRSDSDGFGLSGGSGNNLMSGRAAANLMTRTTAILAAMFIINSLALSVIAAHGRAPSIVETIEKQNAAKDGAPSVPVAGEDAAKKADKKDKAEKKPTVKAEEKAAPAVPDASADVKHEAAPAPEPKKPEVKPVAKDAAPEAAEKPAAPAKKSVKKPAASSDAEPATTADHNE